MKNIAKSTSDSIDDCVDFCLGCICIYTTDDD